jgi:putative endopeptidase
MKIKKFVGICIALLYGFLVIAEQPQKSKPGIDVSLMDLTVKPCVDFYQYANGSWLKQAQIPKENSLWGMVNEVVLRHQRTLSHILKEIVERSDWPHGSIQQKISDFYASGMDEEAIEKEGLKALDSSLKRIQNIRTIKELIIEIGHLHAENIFPCFSFYLAIDEKHASSYICQLDEGGLALSRDDYLKEDDLSCQLRKNYLKHVAHIFELVGDSAKTAENNAKAVIIIETELAKVSMTNVEKREPLALYNRMSREQLMNMAPGILWESYFDTLGLQSSESHFQVSNPKFFQKLSAMFKSISLDDWQIYLRWHLIHNLAPFLHSSIVNEDFHFFQTILNGTQKILPRRKRVNQSLRDALGMAIGQIYVKKVFSQRAKKKVEEMARNIRAVLRERIKKLEWMTASTKQHALKKLDAMVIKIGYPDKWTDYSKLDINRKSYVSNVRRARAFEFKWQMDLLGKPVDRTKWWMTPDQIGARYLSGLNSICVPAGIL